MVLNLESFLKCQVRDHTMLFASDLPLTIAIIK